MTETGDTRYKKIMAVDGPKEDDYRPQREIVFAYFLCWKKTRVTKVPTNSTSSQTKVTMSLAYHCKGEESFKENDDLEVSSSLCLFYV